MAGNVVLPSKDSVEVRLASVVFKAEVDVVPCMPLVLEPTVLMKDWLLVVDSVTSIPGVVVVVTTGAAVEVVSRMLIVVVVVVLDTGIDCVLVITDAGELVVPDAIPVLVSTGDLLVVIGASMVVVVTMSVWVVVTVVVDTKT